VSRVPRHEGAVLFRCSPSIARRPWVPAPRVSRSNSGDEAQSRFHPNSKRQRFCREDPTRLTIRHIQAAARLAEHGRFAVRPLTSTTPKDGSIGAEEKRAGFLELPLIEVKLHQRPKAAGSPADGPILPPAFNVGLKVESKVPSRVCERLRFARRHRFRKTSRRTEPSRRPVEQERHSGFRFGQGRLSPIDTAGAQMMDQPCRQQAAQPVPGAGRPNRDKIACDNDPAIRCLCHGNNAPGNRGARRESQVGRSVRQQAQDIGAKSDIDLSC